MTAHHSYARLALAGFVSLAASASLAETKLMSDPEGLAPQVSTSCCTLSAVEATDPAAGGLAQAATPDGQASAADRAPPAPAEAPSRGWRALLSSFILSAPAATR